MLFRSSLAVASLLTFSLLSLLLQKHVVTFLSTALFSLATFWPCTKLDKRLPSFRSAFRGLTACLLYKRDPALQTIFVARLLIGWLPLINVPRVHKLIHNHSKTSFEKNCFSAWASTLNMGLINKVDMVCLSPVGYGV